MSFRDPGARRVGDGDLASPIDVHDPRHAKDAFRIERKRIEIVVVNAAIQHVDRVIPGGATHRDAPVDHAQIGRFHQFRPHLVGQKRMLVIRRIVDAGRQHRQRGLVGRAVRGAGAQRPRETPRIAGHGLHGNAREQFGKHRHHRFAIFQHVRNARRRARVVFQHHEIVRTGTHDIDAHHMGIDAAGRSEAHHLRQERFVVAQQADRQSARPDNFLAMIEILQEGVQRAYPLLDTARQAAPFARGDDARDHVERDQPFLGILVAVNIEGDAAAPKEAFRFLVLPPQPGGILFFVPIQKFGIRRADGAVRVEHLIVVIAMVRLHLCSRRHDDTQIGRLANRLCCIREMSHGGHQRYGLSNPLRTDRI